MHSIKEIQKKFRLALEAEIISDHPAELYDPIRYIMSIGGKRIRPTLLMLGCEIFGGDIDDAIPAALAVEMFHNFTLVHDDIMDKAPIRRGKETVYKKWNTNIAILAGDTMMPLSYDYILRCDEALIKDVLLIFNQTAKEVCEGQQLDLNFETADTVSIDQYLEMIRLKTAVLLGSSLKIGSILAKASKENIENIYQFGLNLGMAFQLRDDLLDVYGDTILFGKQTGGDIATNKKTFLYLKAIELADTQQKKVLLDNFSKILTDNTEKVEAVIGIYNTLEMKSHSEKLIDDYFQEALKFVDLLSLNEEKKDLLNILAYQIVDRDY